MGDRLRVVVVGLGFGRWLIEHELLAGAGALSCELHGVCDLDGDLARSVAEQHGVRRYADLAAVLADPGVDAVVLMVGPDGRGALVEQCVAAGKPVMTTKPFETSSRAARQALTAARDAGVPVFMNSPTPTPADDLLVIEDWIGRLQLGRPVAYRGTTWCSYREHPDGSWYDDPWRTPAAPLTRLGVYLFADVCRLFAPIETVQVSHSRLFTGRPTADNAAVLLTHRDGVIGTVFSSFCIDDGQPYRLSLELNYERGTIYRNVGPGTGDHVALAVSAVVDGARVVEERRVERTSGYRWDLFARAVRGEDVGPTVSPDLVAEIVSVFEALREAS